MLGGVAWWFRAEAPERVAGLEISALLLTGLVMGTLLQFSAGKIKKNSLLPRSL